MHKSRLREIIQEEVFSFINEHGYDPRKMWPNSYMEQGDGDWMDFFLDTEDGAYGGFGFKPKSRNYVQRVKEAWVDIIADAEGVDKTDLRAVQDVQARVEAMYHANKEHINNYLGDCEQRKRREGGCAEYLYHLYNQNGHTGPII